MTYTGTKYTVIVTSVISVLSCLHPFLKPLLTHYYIDPETNTITSSPDRNTQHIKSRDLVAQTQA